MNRWVAICSFFNFLATYVFIKYRNKRQRQIDSEDSDIECDNYFNDPTDPFLSDDEHENANYDPLESDSEIAVDLDFNGDKDPMENDDFDFESSDDDFNNSDFEEDSDDESDFNNSSEDESSDTDVKDTEVPVVSNARGMFLTILS